MKTIATTIADVEVVYHYTYSPGVAARVNCRVEDSDPGSGADISLEGPFIAGVDIGSIFALLPESEQRMYIDYINEQIELAEADYADDARSAADEDRYERLRDERDGTLR